MGTAITVFWQDNSNNEDGFEIADCAPPFNAPGCILDKQTGANAGLTVFNGLQPNTYKCFFVRAFNSAGFSAWVGGDACTSTQGPSTPTNPTWQLCEHSYYGGRCITVTGNLVDFTTINFNDVASSARRQSGSQCLYLYEHTYYGGKVEIIYPDADSPDLTLEGMNDRTSSAAVAPCEF
jgi:hypothetical protein